MIPDWQFYGPGRVYFVEVQGFIKIGYTAALRQRMYQIGCLNPIPPTLLLAVPGDEDLESYIHFQFQHLRQRFDWFRKAPDLMAFIDRVHKEHAENSIPFDTNDVSLFERLSL